ncbi:MAG TPA: methyltransferase domain-containing protein [bacterium]|nr:methyltransferase domain-containing protein [bacterium]
MHNKNNLSDHIKKENIKIFDSMSAGYDSLRRMEFGTEASRQVLKKYEEALGTKLPEIENLLVLGCGSGYLLLHLARMNKAKKYFGMDISSGMVKACGQNAASLGKRVFLSAADGEMLPFRDGTFDAVIGHAVLHHIPDVQQTLKEVYRTLKPGGFCFFSEPAAAGSCIIFAFLYLFWGGPLLIRKILSIMSGKKRESIELHTFSPEKFQRLGISSGLSGIRTIPFAGFVSRIFYWVLDPVVRVIREKSLRRFIERMTGIIFFYDRVIFSRFIPGGWYDEILFFARKK